MNYVRSEYVKDATEDSTLLHNLLRIASSRDLHSLPTQTLRRLCCCGRAGYDR